MAGREIGEIESLGIDLVHQPSQGIRQHQRLAEPAREPREFFDGAGQQDPAAQGRQRGREIERRFLLRLPGYTQGQLFLLDVAEGLEAGEQQGLSLAALQKGLA
jgi:hypothetical protein